MENQVQLSILKELFIKLSKSLGENPQIYELLATLGEALRQPLNTILDTIPTLQEKKLTLAKQKECSNTLYQAATQMLAIVNDTIHLSQNACLAPRSEISIDTAALEQNELEKALTDLNVLVINEHNAPNQEKLITQLQELGLKCQTTTMDDALQVLYSAQLSNAPFHIAVINANQYDHHVAYLGRTIKANIHLGHVMTCLALANELLTFEKEQAHFDGFACILNVTKADRLANKLAHSWRGWVAKVNFDYGKQPSPAKNHVLLVEDDPIPQKVTQWQLAEMGYTIDTAPDGHTALKLLEQNVYDLIFMDVGLPDISGLEVTAEIRKRENGVRHTPIIGLTIYALESDEKTGLKAGMDEYLVKPVMPDRLKTVLQRWVQNKLINN